MIEIKDLTVERDGGDRRGRGPGLPCLGDDGLVSHGLLVPFQLRIVCTVLYPPVGAIVP